MTIKKSKEIKISTRKNCNLLYPDSTFMRVRTDNNQICKFTKKNEQDKEE